MKTITQITPGLLPIPPNGWGAVEKIIWEVHCNLIKLGYNSKIKYLNEINKTDEVVHIHVANLANAAYERNIPYYFTMHDHHAFLYGKNSQVYKENLQAIKNAKKAFVPAKFLVDYFEGIPEYFSHGVNTEYFTAGLPSFHRLLCVANNGFIHNQSEDRKGFSYAIEAAKQLDLPITVAGPSNNKNYFEKFPSDYEKLTILYDLNEEQLLDLYRQHTIFLHPSILEAGHPNLTLLEAMSCGLPVVGTYEKGNSLAGMIAVERDVEQIKQAVAEILNNHSNYRIQALEQAANLSWKNRTLELLKYYNTNMKDQLIDIYNNTEKKLIAPKEYAPSFNINFIDGAFFEILGDKEENYKVTFLDRGANEVVYSTPLSNNCWAKVSRRYYTDWKITANSGDSIYEYECNLEGRRVLIGLDSKSLGDTLAWFPYVEEFRKKHKCHVIVSTFWNNFFKDNYPELEFVEPGTVVHNIIAKYDIGWYLKDGTYDRDKNPIDPNTQALQKTATDILGLDFKELKPKIKLFDNIEKEKIITIGIHSTAQTKYWNNNTGWQELTDHFKSLGYRVVLLSKEPDGYMGNKHPKGIEQHPPGPIEEVIKLLQKSTLFVGVSSGLSWLSWACNTPTCLISGFTEPELEFECLRVYPKENVCRGCYAHHKFDPGDWNWCPVNKGTDKQFECSKSITAQDVIEKVKHLIA